jgi:hypothetical protein
MTTTNNNVISLPQPGPPPYDEVLFKHYGVKRERLTNHQQTAIALEALDLGYEELLCPYWAFGGI